MTSYISAFKPALFAAFLICAIELAVATHAAPANLSANFFSLNYLRPDVLQKRVIEEKYRDFAHKDAEFLQIGDSSGFFGVQPDIVMRYIPGYAYINASCCADTGFAGYRYMAEALLRADGKRQFLVFYMTPYSLPMHYKDGFSQSLYRAFISPWRFVSRLPSLRYRTVITNVIYYGNYSDWLPGTGPATSDVFNSWRALLPKTGGWAPVLKLSPSGIDIPDRECDFSYFYNEDGKPALKPELEKMKAVADKYHVRLILVFSPVACNPGPKSQPVADDVNAFLKENPDVIAPFPLINNMRRDRFHDRWHLLEGPSRTNSEQVGKALAEIIAKRQRIP